MIVKTEYMQKSG